MIRVVLVDDDPLIGELLSYAVGEEPDISLTHLAGGFAESLRPEVWDGVDVAIVDFFLGGFLSGRGVLAWLAANAPGVRRILLTGLARVGDLDGGLAHAVLHKPVATAAILAAIREGR